MSAMLHHSERPKGTPAADSGTAGASGGIATRGAADWLSLAAAPTFAFMAIVTGALGGPPDMLCASADEAPAITGMVSMYVLMSAFHSAPWLRLAARRRSYAHRS
ncbi:hypothetical protein N181_23030 [Sinorhizobium fredii USDA 205]|nr:hypothetical protein N181_23030 [Sinorhizobium fredii USDA 205]GEC35316.1 hypothetical protein EFR01_54870 [Sinorhizobium fredii]